MACPARNDTMLAANVNAKLPAVKTAAFAHSTGSRAGTAESVERMVPVAYSPVAMSTPTTAVASAAIVTP